MKFYILAILSLSLINNAYAYMPRLQLHIESPAGLQVNILARYQATKDSFRCKKTIIDDTLNFKRVPKVYEQEMKNAGVNTIPAQFDKCDAKLQSVTLFANQEHTEAENVVSVLWHNNSANTTQEVRCRTIKAGPQVKRKDATACYGDIATNPEGVAKIKFTLQD